MFRRCIRWLMWGAVAAAALLSSCKRNEAPPPETPKRFSEKDEPEFVIGRFAVLPKTERASVLPALATSNGEEVDDCFVPVKSASVWQTRSERIRGLLRDNEGAVVASVLAFLMETFPSEKDLFVEPNGWGMTVPNPYVRHVFPAEIHLSRTQTCISDTSRDFPAGFGVKTSAFGAKEMVFTSKTPVSLARLKALKASAAKKKLRVIIKDAYGQAFDARGRPVLGPKKQKLYHSPEGRLVPLKEIPPLSRRKAVEWKLSSPDPIYFASGFLPPSSWKREQLPDACEVFVVYNDSAPQIPSCPMPKIAGFGAEKSKTQNHLRVKAATADETVVQEVAFGETAAVTTGVGVFWITAHKVEEGARLQIDSMVLDSGRAPVRITAFPKVTAEGSEKTKSKEKSKEKSGRPH